MMKEFTIEIAEDHIDEVLDELGDLAKTALSECGIQAVAHAVDKLTEYSAVDTGLLRNSLTYGIGGEKTSVDKYSPSHTPGQHSGRTAKDGSYKGKLPKDDDWKYTLYVGTNVYYAPYVEMGHKHGTWSVEAKPYLKPALNDWKTEYADIITKRFNGK